MSKQDHFNVVILWRSLGPYHLARAEAAAKVLADSGGRVTVIELCDSEETRDWLDNRDVTSFTISTLLPGQILDSTTPDLSDRLVAILDELQPAHVAIAGYDRPEMRSALNWANRARANAILMSETKWDDKKRPWWKRQLISRLISRYDAGLVSGGAAGEYLVSLGMPRERIFRQYGAVDNAYFQNRSASVREFNAWPLPPGERYFVACSRLIEERKNICGLLAAYQFYRKVVEKPWDLVICGDGEDRPLIEKKIRDEGISGVTLAGFKQIADLATIYAKASGFIHPAVREAWGLVVNEAMAAGLPVLVSRKCGCAYDLVHEGVNGFTFDPHSPQDLAKRMQEMTRYSDGELKSMAMRSQEIVGRFGVEAFAMGLRSAIELVGLKGTCSANQSGSSVA